MERTTDNGLLTFHEITEEEYLKRYVMGKGSYMTYKEFAQNIGWDHNKTDFLKTCVNQMTNETIKELMVTGKLTFYSRMIWDEGLWLMWDGEYRDTVTMNRMYDKLLPEVELIDITEPVEELLSDYIGSKVSLKKALNLSPTHTWKAVQEMTATTAENLSYALWGYSGGVYIQNI
ncbi:hypothetical protein [Acidaminococcus massiliensis]|jgi:hypothetical protein|uniref:hypothetical protein n=1 Tax=Acidaminococcus massiliensis TaxID=1852375 RepID=UPI00094EDDB4|nr:hypothetical protein [Acidaminococcus massiliensis]